MNKWKAQEKLRKHKTALQSGEEASPARASVCVCDPGEVGWKVKASLLGGRVRKSEPYTGGEGKLLRSLNRSGVYGPV